MGGFELRLALVRNQLSSPVASYQPSVDVAFEHSG